MKKELHPSIEEFKLFVKNHPNLIKEVRSGKKTWQEIYEDWYLLGETDKQWDQYKSNHTDEKEANKDFISKFLTSFKNMNIENVQEQLSNAGNAISTIQTLIKQFKQPDGESNQKVKHHPFAFRKD